MLREKEEEGNHGARAKERRRTGLCCRPARRPTSPCRSPLDEQARALRRACAGGSLLLRAKSFSTQPACELTSLREAPMRRSIAAQRRLPPRQTSPAHR